MTNPHRVQPGVPAGGQFATGHRDESPADLAEQTHAAEQVRAHELRPGDVLPGLDDAVITGVDEDPMVPGQGGRMIRLSFASHLPVQVPLNLLVERASAQAPAWQSEPALESALGRPVADLTGEEKTALGRLVTDEDGDYDPDYLAPFAHNEWDPEDIGYALDAHLDDEVRVEVETGDKWEVSRRPRKNSRAHVEYLDPEARGLACTGRTTSLDRAVGLAVLVTHAYDRAGDPATRSGWSADAHARRWPDLG